MSALLTVLTRKAARDVASGIWRDADDVDGSGCPLGGMHTNARRWSDERLCEWGT